MDPSNLIPTTANNPLEEALRRLPDDQGILFETAILEQLKVLRSQDPAEFARIRYKVKGTKHVQMAEFDRLTGAIPDRVEKNESSFFPNVEPWNEHVDGSELLDEIVDTLGRFVIAEKSTLEATALWCIFTWFIDDVTIAPIANITAPEKRCGKTVLLTTMSKLVFRPFSAANIATAALFRSIEQWSPTLLIDEVDSFLRENEEARGILNAGFEKEGAFVVRCVGDEHTPTRFNVWGAKALCGIGKLSDTIEDRSIVLPLRRKKSGETAENLRRSDPNIWQDLRRKIARFYYDNNLRVKASIPEEIPSLNDRANDCWEPLLQIAEVVGGEWPGRARAAACEISGTDSESLSTGVELLTDIQAIFSVKTGDKISTADLLLALTNNTDLRWATWYRGQPMSARQLAKRLSDYNIRPNTIRINQDTMKGYKLAQFQEAFDRYITAGTPITTVTSSHLSKFEDDVDFTGVKNTCSVTAKIR